jgi:hypothetical protein
VVVAAQPHLSLSGADKAAVAGTAYSTITVLLPFSPKRDGLPFDHGPSPSMLLKWAFRRACGGRFPTFRDIGELIAAMTAYHRMVLVLVTRPRRSID